ncbi:class IIb bacteriocin, lactobin A/cerein 7B family [Flavobacterium branchiarum]|uniref:Class IIb bacteriocin, lactobin A/cerein 7B family n=1 Tax=Flavobacterium branchiarum TaxID=1114870 RepID=A0ABV5FPH0_9FLAO|nr:class IIb bacteriocin, lactobin A/cerein 7B family [Flavobacterium branchiarum]MDN3675516.1 class IIb bacteriocin, lactobin A/cerein 7B family [Flavobacterium branchiarum]
MKTIELKELSQKELIEIEGGFGPMYYAIVGIWSLGVSYGYLTNI